MHRIYTGLLMEVLPCVQLNYFQYSKYLLVHPDPHNTTIPTFQSSPKAPVPAARVLGLVTSEVKWGADREGAAGEMLLRVGWGRMDNSWRPDFMAYRGV